MKSCIQDCSLKMSNDEAVNENDDDNDSGEAGREIGDHASVIDLATEENEKPRKRLKLLFSSPLTTTSPPRVHVNCSEEGELGSHEDRSYDSRQSVVSLLVPVTPSYPEPPKLYPRQQHHDKQRPVVDPSLPAQKLPNPETSKPICPSQLQSSQHRHPSTTERTPPPSTRRQEPTRTINTTNYCNRSVENLSQTASSIDESSSHLSEALPTCEQLSSELTKIIVLPTTSNTRRRAHRDSANYTFRKLRKWIRTDNTLFLENFFDLGGILHLLLYLKHNLDDPTSMDHVARIFSHCIYSSHRSKQQQQGSESDHHNITSDSEKIRHRVSTETACMIVKRNGIQYFMDANAHILRGLSEITTMVDGGKNTEPTLIVLSGIWRVIRILAHSPFTTAQIPVSVLYLVIESGLATLERVGNCIDANARNSKSSKQANKTVSQVHVHVFESLQYIFKYSSIENDETFLTQNKDILVRCINALSSKGGSDGLSSQSLFVGKPNLGIKVFLAAKTFFIGFFVNFQLGSSKERFRLFRYELLVPFFLHFIGGQQQQQQNGAIVQLLDWIVSRGLVENPMEKYGVAAFDALKTARDSDTGGKESKNRARCPMED